MSGLDEIVYVCKQMLEERFPLDMIEKLIDHARTGTLTNEIIPSEKYPKSARALISLIENNNNSEFTLTKVKWMYEVLRNCTNINEINTFSDLVEAFVKGEINVL